VTVTSFGGNLRADSGSRTLTNAIALQPGVYFAVTGTNDLTLNGTVKLLASAQTFVVMSMATTKLGGTISNGTAGVNKVGPGVLVLTDNNTYSGTTTVNADTLIVNNTAGSGTGSGSVVVNPGAISGGSGTVDTGGAQTVTVAGGAVVRPGGSATGISTLTINSTANVTFAAGSTLQVNVGTSATAGGHLKVIGGGTVELSRLTTMAPLNIYQDTGCRP
jgi:fibronectin-binding autotransporter adhesin